MDAETQTNPHDETVDRNARDMANAIRALAIDAVQKANSGHPGMPMGMADVATVLFRDFVRVDPKNPSWPDRDRFVLSNGHGSMLLYAIHHLLGYEDMSVEELKNFRQIGSKTAGHPEYGHALGIETTTGPLGQGLANAVGFALAERMMNARFGDDLVDHKTYVIAGDGCLMEGISHEAIDLAGHLKLSKLIVLFDDNGISIDGKTSLATSMDQVARFKAAGWNAEQVDGHKPDDVKAALERAQSSDKPTMIACKTIIGYGSPKLAGSEKSHGAPLGDEEIKATREKLVWESEPFELPESVTKAWHEVAAKGAGHRNEWEKRASGADRKAEFDAFVSGKLPDGFEQAMADYRAKLVTEKPKLATRKSSEATLGLVNELTDLTIGGSADLTHSVFTKTGGQTPVSADNYAGQYIHYGIREHAMAAVMNGLALHGGFIPYGGTFLTFADYMRGGMRLSALMGIRVVYVLTHDSIGLGEDGPTHQPVEHLAMLRATPNMLVLRPADAVETAEAWEIALTETKRPSVLSLSRQNLPTVREDAAENRSRRGAYVLRDTDGARDVTLMATGSEIEIAIAAAEQLKGEGIEAAVVSFPCWELFAEQDEGYRASVLGSAPRVAIEAALGFGWERWLGDKGRFIGMQGFGASGPAPKLYEEFGITAAHAVKAAKELLGR